MIQGYEVERWSGIIFHGPGENGWNKVLSHQDIVEPGLVKSFSVINNGNRIKIELEKEDILFFTRRTPLGAPSPRNRGTRIIFGKKSGNGDYFFIVYSDGSVRVTNDTSIA